MNNIYFRFPYAGCFCIFHLAIIYQFPSYPFKTRFRIYNVIKQSSGQFQRGVRLFFPYFTKKSGSS